MTQVIHLHSMFKAQNYLKKFDHLEPQQLCKFSRNGKEPRCKNAKR